MRVGRERLRWSATGHGPAPWALEEMLTSIVIRDAAGHTVCNLPKQKNEAQRRANAELIVNAVNRYLKEE